MQAGPKCEANDPRTETQFSQGRANHAQVYKRMVAQSDGSTTGSEKKAKFLHSHKSLGTRVHHGGIVLAQPEMER
jgi:hypothetical protein